MSSCAAHHPILVRLHTELSRRYAYRTARIDTGATGVVVLGVATVYKNVFESH